MSLFLIFICKLNIMDEIGKINSNLVNKDVWIDDSIKPKKGQLGYVDKTFITEGEEILSTDLLRT